jgi:hypothetical protein
MPRKQKKYHYIYKTTNIVNGKYYIGMHSTNNLEDGYIGSGKRLWYSIQKYGRENFNCEILEMLPNRVSLKQREKELVNEQLLKDKLCMNIVYGGGGGYISPDGCKKGGSNMLKKMWKDENFRENQIKRISDWAKEMWADGKFKYKDNWTGKKHTLETIEKMKTSKIGHGIGGKNSQFGTCWITNGVENQKIKKEDLIPEGWMLGRCMNRLK